MTKKEGDNGFKKDNEINEIKKLVPDTSVIIEGLVSKKIEDGEIKPKIILIHEAVLSELEHQSNQNKAIGYLGLDELKKLREISVKYNFEIQFSGKRPTAAEIRYASLGEIDSLIRDLAFDEDGTLFSADKIQARIAETKGIKHIFIHMEQIKKKIILDTYFDSTAMSVHLRENVYPYAKKGIPGDWKFVKLSNKLLTRDYIQEISTEIIEEAGIRKDGFIEIERSGSTIIQLGRYRIVITKPPFSDGWEITAVRPVKILSLEDYKLSEKLMERVSKQAEGILIAGSPGMGKSTFAQALAEYYASQDRIVKTIEAPRDLVLNDNVTQYAISHGDAQEVHDVLLLSRPDNTIFDEMRNTSDFQLFADLRLAGIGLAGVVHATNPIDAIQRFVGRIELGVIPQVIDTVIFIKNGQVFKVLSLNMTVKVPSGMTEADLARPVVVVNDFETKKLEYELYSYGEETVVIPVLGGGEKSASRKLAAKIIENEFRKYSDDVSVEVISDNKAIVRVPENRIAKIIGRKGENISLIEKRLGISIDVQEMDERGKKDDHNETVAFNTQITKHGIVFFVDHAYKNRDIHVYINDDFLLTVKVSPNSNFKINKKNKLGKLIIDAVNMNERLELRV
ncbi:MAG: PINc/VapC family ATPase [Candidatus Woesearchaeota archaeon]